MKNMDMWNKLYYIAKEQIQDNPKAEQIVVLRTDKPWVYSFENRVLTHGSEDEDRLIQDLMNILQGESLMVKTLATTMPGE